MKKDLIYDDFKKYEIPIPDNSMIQASKLFHYECYMHRFKFDNNYGASVVKNFGSYGYREDLFELAVTKFNENDDVGHLCYDTPITDDVIGFLSNDEVLNLLNKIKNL